MGTRSKCSNALVATNSFETDPAKIGLNTNPEEETQNDEARQSDRSVAA